ncbi:MAG: hypothetical protein AAGJ55_01995, partial [Cyanobacteria bacterium J06555_12]
HLCVCNCQCGIDIGKTRETASTSYPGFADVDAALTVAYAQMGTIEQAKIQWAQAVRADDRYRDLDWVTSVRRWSPATVDGLTQFLSLTDRS